MSFGSVPFGQGTFGGTVYVPITTPPIGGDPEVQIVIDPFTIEINGMSMKGKQLVDTLSIDMQMGGQGTASFAVINLNFVPDIGMPVRILFYSEVLFAGAIDRVAIESNNAQSFVRYDVECTDNTYLLFRNKIKQSFTNQTLSSIATSIINNNLAYDGISLGVVESGITIPSAEADGVSAFEFLNELAISVGLTLSIDNNKVLSFTGPSLNANVPALDSDNVESCRYELDRDTYRNVQTTTVTGTTATQGEQAKTVTLTRINQEQLTQRRLIEGNGGWYSEFVSITHPSSNDTVMLNRLANAYNKVWLGVSGSINRTISIRTREMGYRPGQLIPVTVSQLGISGSWVVKRVSMREASGRFLIYDLELSQSTLTRRIQEIWIDVVQKGTVSILPPSAVYSNTVTITTLGSSTWSVPGGVEEVQITCYGPGGGGGGGAKSEWPGYGGIVYANGSAGGGGGLVISVLRVTPGETLTLAIGSGGAGGAGQYRFESFSNAVGASGASGGVTSVSRPGNTLIYAYGGANGIGGIANARFQQTQSFPDGAGGGGLYGHAITAGGAANGGAGGTGSSYSSGGTGGHGKVVIEW